MSGFEVVGVVLGAIPLLISGLEHYGDGVHTIRTMWSYERVVRRMAGEFRLSQAIFRRSCEDLLKSMLEDAKVNKLMDGESPDWSDPDLGHRLRERLNPDHGAYVECVRNLEIQIEHFSGKLGLVKGEMLVRHVYTNVKRLYHLVTSM